MKSWSHAAVRCGVGLLLTAFAIHPASLSARTILAAGQATTWKYLDGDNVPATDWNQPGFDDSQWKSGRAPLGYGEPRLSTQIRGGRDAGRQPVTAWFRCEFDSPDLKPGVQLVIQCCVDDGAIVYLNGQEIARQNMPPGPASTGTFALRVLGDEDEGFYVRLRVPSQAVRARQKNVLAVEVHQGAAKSSDLYFDLAVKSLPAEQAAKAAATAEEVVNLYRKQHYVAPGVTIPDGYIDGGRRMAIDAGGHATSGREILQVDRARDVELADELAFARSPEVRALAPRARIQRIAARIDLETTPPGGMRWVVKTTAQLEEEFTNKPLLIGDWIDQCQAGVCRHRSLLFKILADEAGLSAALVRGNYLSKSSKQVPHAWNEVLLTDGRRVLVDVMHNGGRAEFLEVTSAEAAEHYLKVNGAPWYRAESR